MRRLRTFTYRDAKGDRSLRTVMELYRDDVHLHAINMKDLTGEQVKELLNACMTSGETPMEFYSSFVKEFNSRTGSYKTFRIDRMEETSWD